MAKGGFNSANRALDKAMKSKGLQKLRWYCQVCEKQCRDENGFKCHTQTEGHLRMMLVVGESAGKHIDEYSTRFQQEFISLLSRRWGTKRVRANLVYQEYISDKHHIHMNATRWLSLTEFTKHLGRTGVCHVDETEKGWFVEWIDNSPRALARARGDQKKEKGDMDDESRERKLIQEQIERARREGEKRMREAAGSLTDEGDEAADRAPARELVRDEGGKLSLNFSFSKPGSSTALNPDGPPVSSSSSTPSLTSAPSASSSVPPPTKLSLGAGKPLTVSSNPLKKANPLKSNPLKSSSLSTSASSHAGTKRAAEPKSAVEAIMEEELRNKQRKMTTAGSGESGKKARYF